MCSIVADGGDALGIVEGVGDGSVDDAGSSPVAVGPGSGTVGPDAGPGAEPCPHATAPMVWRSEAESSDEEGEDEAAEEETDDVDWDDAYLAGSGPFP